MGFRRVYPHFRPLESRPNTLPREVPSSRPIAIITYYFIDYKIFLLSFTLSTPYLTNTHCMTETGNGLQVLYLKSQVLQAAYFNTIY